MFDDDKGPTTSTNRLETDFDTDLGLDGFGRELAGFGALAAIVWVVGAALSLSFLLVLAYGVLTLLEHFGVLMIGLAVIA